MNGWILNLRAMLAHPSRTEADVEELMKRHSCIVLAGILKGSDLHVISATAKAIEIKERARLSPTPDPQQSLFSPVEPAN